MKKSPFILLAFQVMVLVATAQKPVDRKYEFPIKPGSATWQSFTTHKQMVEATALPEKTAAGLTTRALLETCLDYPLLMDMMAFNTPQKGLEAVTRNFNGLQQLMTRKDVAVHLADAYQQRLATDINKLPSLYEKGKLSFQLSFIEILFAQRPVLGTVDKAIVALLKTHITKALAFKTTHSEVFSATNSSYTMFFAGNLYRHFYKTEFSAAALEFLTTGLLKDTTVIGEIEDLIR
jgi:hypothetical protein